LRAQNAAGALRRTPLGELTAPPHPLAGLQRGGVKGVYGLAKGRVRKGDRKVE